jgi:NADH-quinone oxidoreductase subunit N
MLMLITMFSMAGVPPTIGFYAKFTVLQAALQAGYIWAVVFAVLMAVIGAFYYLRIVKLMYFDAPYFDALQDSAEISAPDDMKLILSINALALLVLGMLPQGLMNICGAAIGRSLQ